MFRTTCQIRALELNRVPLNWKQAVRHAGPALFGGVLDGEMLQGTAPPSCPIRSARAGLARRRQIAAAMAAASPMGTRMPVTANRADDFGNAAAVGGDDRLGGGHAFDNHLAERLAGGGGVNENIKIGSSGTSVQEAGEFDGIIQLKPGMARSPDLFFVLFL